MALDKILLRQNFLKVVLLILLLSQINNIIYCYILYLILNRFNNYQKSSYGESLDKSACSDDNCIGWFISWLCCNKLSQTWWLCLGSAKKQNQMFLWIHISILIYSCSGLDLKYLPKAHVLETWPPMQQCSLEILRGDLVMRTLIS